MGIVRIDVDQVRLVCINQKNIVNWLLITHSLESIPRWWDWKYVDLYFLPSILLKSEEKESSYVKIDIYPADSAGKNDSHFKILSILLTSDDDHNKGLQH